MAIDYSSIGPSASGSRESAGLPPTASPVPSAQELSSVTIRRAGEQGFTVEQSFKLNPPEMSRDTETLSFESFDAMVAHLQETFAATPSPEIAPTPMP